MAATGSRTPHTHARTRSFRTDRIMRANAQQLPPPPPRSMGGRGRPGETGWRFLCLCFQYPNKRGRACLRPNTNKYTTSNQHKKKQCSRRLNAIYLTQKFRWCQRQEFACGSRVATNARARVLDRIPISFAGELARARIFWWQRANRRDAPRRALRVAPVRRTRLHASPCVAV